MAKWEYARVDVVLYDEGTGAGRQELLYLTLPGDDRKHVTNLHGSIGLLNELGLDGWELVDAEPQVFFLKRPRK